MFPKSCFSEGVIATRNHNILFPSQFEISHTLNCFSDLSRLLPLSLLLFSTHLSKHFCIDPMIFTNAVKLILPSNWFAVKLIFAVKLDFFGSCSLKVQVYRWTHVLDNDARELQYTDVICHQSLVAVLCNKNLPD